MSADNQAIARALVDHHLRLSPRAADRILTDISARIAQINYETMLHVTAEGAHYTAWLNHSTVEPGYWLDSLDAREWTATANDATVRSYQLRSSDELVVPAWAVELHEASTKASRASNAGDYATAAKFHLTCSALHRALARQVGKL